MMGWWVWLGCAVHVPGTSVPTASEPVEACAPLEAGTRHGRRFDADGVQRIYSIHVPDGLDACAPVVVDLHGAYGGEKPEQAYVLDEAIAAADAWGFVLLRPRGLEVERYGTTWYYWNYPEMLKDNADFVEALVQDQVPEARARYLMGYSSGADLTGWALAKGRDWDGFAMIAGASWSVTGAFRAVDGEGPPVYVQMGARDYLASVQVMVAQMDAAGHDPTRRWVDTGAGGHRLARMHYDRAFPFLSEGVRPSLQAADPAWSSEVWGEGHLLSLDPASDGLRAGDERGQVWEAGQASPRLGAPVTGLCGGFATGYGVTSLGGGSSPLPTTGGAYSFVHHLACEAARVVAVGDRLYLSEDQGSTWDARALGFEWFGSAVRGDRAVAVGRSNGVAVWEGGGWSSRTVAVEGREIWLYGAAVGDDGTWWVVGEEGTLASSVDGIAWDVTTGLTELPLYAVDARDGVVVAVGHDGAVFVSVDDGANWMADPVPAGFLAGVRLRDGQIEAVGADGAVWRRPVP